MRKLLLIASISGILAVVLGAFGAHALKSKLSEEAITSYHTAVSYQYYHTLSTILSAIVFMLTKQKMALQAGWLFLTGILLFSGSIYLLSTRDITGIQWITSIGWVTPIGGLFFILGWTWLLRSSLKLN